MSISFTGKVALITGASSGIGAATAVLFSKLGAKVAIVGRNAEALAQVEEECKSHTQVFCCTGDLTNDEDVKNIFQQTVDHYKQLDILVNNAGILELGSIEQTSMEQYDRVMAINTRSLYHLTMLATPELIKQKGAIVNVSSVNGIRSFAGVLAYNISKAAVDQLTRCVALELAPKGVRVNCVNPGVIITKLHRKAGLDEATYAKFLERSKETHALGRPGNVDEVAHTIAFLASDWASFITGASVPVDGGRHAMCPR